MLRDLIDVPRARPVIDALSASTGCAFALLDPQGGVVLAAGWRSVCLDFHRAHTEAAAECDRHDRALPGLPCTGGRAVTVACPHGLVVSAAPIVVDGRDIGRAVAGQVFLRPPDPAEVAASAGRYGFDEAAYRAAIGAVPVVNQEALDSARDRLLALAGEWVESGVQRHRAGLVSLAEGLWCWERRHPEWHPGEWGARVGCYAVDTPEVLLLVDPLVDGDADPLLPVFDELVAGAHGAERGRSPRAVRVIITIPYHARSAELLWRRYAAHDAMICGHALAAKRLTDTRGFRSLVGGDAIDDVARVHAIGSPVRAELPLEIPAQRALVFGDAVVEVDGELRVWTTPPTTERRRHWYYERFLPTMARLADLDIDRVLVTHGRPVLTEGRAALVGALAREPWHGSAS
ncbi:MAG: PocR ligand-binding domain-containing protein [Actinobacteria bacterium]|nr:PocR ligand-binding domain-containing protein [Actinomycetota bacterium]